MADQAVSVRERISDGDCPGEVGLVGKGANPAAELCATGARRWWRLGLGALAMTLLLASSAILPPSCAVWAEAPLGDPVAVGSQPTGVAVNPATNRVYVANEGSGSVSVVDGATSTVIGLPIQVGGVPAAVAVNPTTGRLYVANRGDGTVSVVDVVTNTLVGRPIAVGPGPRGIAVNATTNRVYVANSSGSSVSVVDGASGTVVGSPITVGSAPQGIAVNPATNRIYVANVGGDTVSVIDGATSTVVGMPIAVGTSPTGVAVNPVTNRVYVANQGGFTVTVIDGATNRVVGAPISVGAAPSGVAVNAATNEILVTNTGGTNVTVIDGTAGAPVGLPVPTGRAPAGIAVNQVTTRAYVANLLDGSVTVLGIPLSLRPSTAGAGSVVTAAWNSLFVTNGTDFVGFYEVGAPNTSPLTRRFTNGTTSPGGPGVVAGSVELPLPADLAAGGHFEVRLNSGAIGVQLAQAGDTAPTAANDSFTVSMGGTLNVPAPGVLANDADADGPPLQATVVTNPAHGTLALQPNGAFSYTPSATFSGTDSFSYRVLDQAGLPATATVTMTVTAAPVGTNDAYTAAQGSTLTVPAPGVLANDTDPDSPSLQATIATNPAHGVLHLQEDGGFTYTPTAGFSGTDSFTYRATDQSSVSAPVTVTLTVTVSDCTPRPPVKVTSAPGSGKLTVHVQAGPLNTQQPNPVRSLRFGRIQNANVAVNGQPVASGQTFNAPADSSAIDFTVERATPGQPTTVPFTVVDGCGEWPTFVGGGPGAGF